MLSKKNFSLFWRALTVFASLCVFSHAAWGSEYTTNTSVSMSGDQVAPYEIIANACTVTVSLTANSSVDGDMNLFCSGTASAGKIIINLSGYSLNVTGSVNFGSVDSGSYYSNIEIQGSGNFSAANFYAQGMSSESNTVSVAGSAAVSVSANLTVSAYSTVSVAAGSISVSGVIENNGTVEFGANDFTTSAAVTNNGTISADAGSLSFSGILSGSGTVLKTGAAGSVTFEKAVSQSSVSTAGAAVVGANITTSGKQTYSGNVTITSDAVFNSTGENVEFGSSAAVTSGGKSVGVVVPAGKSALFYGGFLDSADLSIKGNASVYGANTFSSITIDNSEYDSQTTVKFEDGKLQKITGSCSFKGNSRTNTLTLSSATDGNRWNVYFDSVPSESVFFCTVIKDSASVESDGTTGKELNLVPSVSTVLDSNPSSVTCQNWFTYKYYWLGGIDSSWVTVGNWSYDSAGVYPALAYPPCTDSSSEIVIATSDSADDLDLASGISGITDIKLKSLAVNSSKRLGIGSCSIETAGNIVNNGTIALYGTQAVPLKAASGYSISHSSDSIIEYYGDGNAYDVLDNGTSGNYYNLLLNKSGGTLTFENSVSAVSLTTKKDDGNTGGYSVEFFLSVAVSGAGNVSFGQFDTSSDSIIQAVDVTFKESITGGTSGNLVFCGNVILDKTGDVTIENSNGSIYFYKSLDASSSGNTSVKIDAGAQVKFVAKGSVNCVGANIKDFTIQNGETHVLSGYEIKPGGAQSYQAVVNAGTITGNSSLITVKDVYTSTGTAVFNASSSQTVFNNNVDLRNTVFTANGGAVVFGRIGSQALYARTDGTTVFCNVEINSGASLSVLNKITAEEINNYGTVSSASEVKVSKSILNNGTLSFGETTVVPSGSTFSVTGVAPSGTTFSSLNCSAAASATLTVGVAITVAGDLTLSGASGNLLTVDGAGSINISASQAKGRYLSVDAASAPKITGGIYTAYESTTATSSVTRGWNILSSALVYVWNGSSDTSWNSASNWNTGTVPGTGTAVGADVEIPSVSGANYPQADVVCSIGKLSIGSSSVSEPSLTLDENIMTVAGTLSNYGTIVYTGSARITSDGTSVKNDSAHGTVEYKTGTGTITDFGAADYFNLTVSSGSWTADGDVLAAGDVSVSGGTASFQKSLAVGGSLSVSADASVYFNAGSGGAETKAKSAVFSTTGTVNFGNESSDSFLLSGTSVNLSLPSVLGNLIFAGEISASSSGSIILEKDASLASDTVFKSNLNLASDVTLDGSYAAVFNGTLESSVSGTGRVIELKNAGLRNNAAVTDVSVKFTETSQTEQSFVPFAASEYDGVTVEKNYDGDFKVLTNSLTSKLVSLVRLGNGTFETDIVVSDALSFTKTTSVTFSGLVDSKTVADSVSAGNLIFNGGMTVVDSVVFSTTGVLTLGNSSTDNFSFAGGVKAVSPSEKKISGVITASGGDIDFGTTKTTVMSESTVKNSYGGAITFAAVYFDSDVTLTVGDAVDTNAITAGEISTSSDKEGSVVVRNLGSVSFSGDIGSSSLSLNTLLLDMGGGSVSFEDGKKVYVYALQTSSGTYDITAESDVFAVSSSALSEISCVGVLALGNSSTDSFSFAGGVKAVSPSEKKISGVITAYGGDIDFGTTKTTVMSESTVKNSSGGAITFAAVYFDSDVTLTVGEAGDTNAITAGKISTSSDKEGSVIVRNLGSVSFSGDIGSSSVYLGEIRSEGAGTAEFSGAVYASSVYIAGKARLYGGVVNTNGGQTYCDSVMLGADTVLSAVLLSEPQYIKFLNEVVGDTKNLTISSGTATAGIYSFKVNLLSIEAGASFVQTGCNDEDLGNIQSAAGIMNDGSCVFDSDNEGGKLRLSGSVTGANAVNTKFGNKVISLDSSCAFNGIVNAGELFSSDGIVSGGEISIIKSLSVNSNHVYKIPVVKFNPSPSDSAAVNVAEGVILSFGTEVSVTGDMNIILSDKAILKTLEDCDITLSDGKFSQSAGSGTAFVMLAGGIITSGANGLDFESDVYTFASGGADSGMSLGGGTEPVVFRKNIYFATAGGKSTEINSALKAKNIVLLGGKIVLYPNAVLDAEEDIVLLNGNADSIFDDTNTGSGNAPSGVENLFSYIRDSAYSETGNACSSISSIPDEYPDESTAGFPDGSGNPYTGTIDLDSLSSSSFTAAGNFYCNGTDLSATGAWTLIVKDNTDASSAFAELYNSAVSNCTVSAVSGTAYLAAAENCTDGGGNTNIFFSRPKILAENSAAAKDIAGSANLSGTYTVYDNVVRVEFVDSITNLSTKIENSNNEISKAVSNIKFGVSGGSALRAFEGAYTNAECTQTTDGQGDLAVFFLKASDSYSWNTDSCGISAGNSQSTDWNGTHKTSVPFLNIPKALARVYQTLRDEHKNRIAHYYSVSPDLSSENESSGATFTATADRCPPVLVAVRTGQEKHTENDGTAQNQPYYDSHNFIELQFSESVSTGGISLEETDDEILQNTKSSADFGEINGNSGTGLDISGLVKISGGKLDSGSVLTGAADNTVHSVYRKFSLTAAGTDSLQTHRLRVGIAGYVDKTVSAGGGTHKHWLGYIDEAETPYGTVTRLSSDSVSGTAQISDAAGNVLDFEGTAEHTLPDLSVDSSEEELYGKWDVSSPVFAKYRNRFDSGETGYEALGTSAVENTTLDRIEFHLFDNEENPADWYIRTGWADSSGTLYRNYSYAADIFGGSRPFDSSESKRTSGGIRYSSVYNKSGFFKYSIKGSSEENAFSADDITGGAKGLVFLTQSEVTHSTGGNDGLYFAVYFSDTTIPLKATFEVKFDEEAYVTDLAGNRMKSQEITTIDRTPPTFNMTVAAVPNGDGNEYKELYIVFNKSLNTDSVSVYEGNLIVENKDFSTAVRDSLVFVDASTGAESDITVSSTEPVVVKFRNTYFTGILVPLSRSLTYEDIKNIWVQAKIKDEDVSTDPLSGVDNARVTFIQDATGNYLANMSAHAISDFAVNVVNPVYAYSDFSSGTEDNGAVDIDYSRYMDGSWAVHDWSAEQKNYGTLSSGYDLYVIANLSGGKDSASELPDNVFTYFDSNPSSNSLSNVYNENVSGSGLSEWRVWLPDYVCSAKGDVSPSVKSPPFKALAENNNKTAENTFCTADKEGDADGSQMKFSLSLSRQPKWSGSQISFLFGLADGTGAPVTICHAPEYNSLTGSYVVEKSPLFSLRLKKPGDLTSVDLWSFRLQDVKKQRGGVTILNNVINAENGEKTVVQVDMPSSGNLNVIVMTLDGNIVQYLQHGEASAGEHYYTWNGTTKSGRKVARGLYFIRIFGNGIDETRKVMVVK